MEPIGTDLHHIAVLELSFLLDEPPVHPGATCGAEILEDKGPVTGADPSVNARHLRVVQDEVICRGIATDKDRAVFGDDEADDIKVEDDEREPQLIGSSHTFGWSRVAAFRSNRGVLLARLAVCADNPLIRRSS